jgi:PadR family transcriptional regulator PadR
MNLKGSLPLVILHTLSHGPKHGYRIAKIIKNSSEGVLNIAEGTLYPTLHDLEKRGLIEAFEDTVKGRTRRCYRLTVAGEKELAKQRQEWNEYAHAMDRVLGGAS